MRATLRGPAGPLPQVHPVNGTHPLEHGHRGRTVWASWGGRAGVGGSIRASPLPCSCSRSPERQYRRGPPRLIELNDLRPDLADHGHLVVYQQAFRHSHPIPHADDLFSKPFRVFWVEYSCTALVDQVPIRIESFRIHPGLRRYSRQHRVSRSRSRWMCRRFSYRPGRVAPCSAACAPLSAKRSRASPVWHRPRGPDDGGERHGVRLVPCPVSTVSPSATFQKRIALLRVDLTFMAPLISSTQRLLQA